MDKLISEEIEKFKSVAMQLQFEGISLSSILDTLQNHLVIKINETKKVNKTQ